jgi:hypothetical protein
MSTRDPKSTFERSGGWHGSELSRVATGLGTEARQSARCTTLAGHLAQVSDKSTKAILSSRICAQLREPAPHADPMEKDVEPKRPLAIRVIDLAVAFKDGLMAARVFVRRTEQGLGQVEELVPRRGRFRNR